MHRLQELRVPKRLEITVTHSTKMNVETPLDDGANPVSDDTEFDRFVYLVSHDLRACARALTVIPEWIEEDLRDAPQGLIPEVAENVAMMKTHANRLDQMLLDLLSYARIGRKQDFALISVASLIDRILNELAPSTSVKIVRDIQVEQIFLGETDAKLLFSALISNAIKHGSCQTTSIKDEHGKPAQIEICVRQTDGYCDIQVHDNGLGIPQKYHNKVLEPLATLKPRDLVEGSGMGLAIVNKISSVYNGFLSWHENSAGTGFSLAIHLPMHQPIAQTDLS